MSDSGSLILNDEEIDALTPAERTRYEAIVQAELDAISHLAWRETARPEQLPPEGVWRKLFLRGGRGGGKTHAASRIFAELIAEDPARAERGPGQWAVVAPTYADVRDTCIEGESGLLAALGTSRVEVDGRQARKVESWNRSTGELRLRDGSVVFCDGADDGALRVQGKNLRGCWAEEIGLWRQHERAFHESIAYALRQGDAKLIASGTPKIDQPARALVRELLKDPDVIVRRLRTMDNADHLSPTFLADRAKQAGSRLGRQELEGELLEDVEGAVWNRAWIDDARVENPPRLGFTSAVLGLDPSDGTASGDEQGSCLAARDIDGKLYVIESRGDRLSPMEWLKRMVALAREHSAVIVVEKNHGGAYLTGLLEQVIRETGVRVPYKVVTASVGKKVRAEPVAMLYEQGHVHHLGHHPELEEQQVTWDGTGKSPDRCDALVWAITELMGYGGHGGVGDGQAVPYPDLVTDAMTGEIREMEPEEEVRLLGRRGLLRREAVEHGAVQWAGSAFDEF